MFKEFYFVLTFIKDFISQHGLLELYQQLATDVKAAQTAEGEEAVEIEQRIKESKLKLYEAHGNINLLLWTPPQKAILKNIDAYPIVGKRAVDKIHKSFNRQTASQNVIVQDLNELHSKTSELNSRVQQLLTNLNLDEYSDTIPDEMSTVEIAFTKHSGFTNFWESETRSKSWSFIFKAIAELTGDNYEEIQTISWNSSSPQIGVWVKGGAKFVKALISVGKAAAGLKSIKDKIFKKKEDAKKLGAEEDVVKIVQESIERNIGKLYNEKKDKKTIELRITYGEKSKRPSGDGDNFVRMALDAVVQELADGVKIIDPKEVRPVAQEHEEGDEKLFGTLYKKDHKLAKQINKYLEVETQKRLEQRSQTMRRELEQAIKITPTTKWSKKDIIKLLMSHDLKTYGTKEELIDRFNKYKEKDPKKESKEKSEKIIVAKKLIVEEPKFKKRKSFPPKKESKK